mmetsp:Transcript_38944/g.122849  ORF Transcript_38944/g.122849 Transcript_38944/m.122849 type:complete len:208 (+) Transcript_38944:288-911(+)
MAYQPTTSPRPASYIAALLYPVSRPGHSRPLLCSVGWMIPSIKRTSRIWSPYCLPSCGCLRPACRHLNLLHARVPSLLLPVLRRLFLPPGQVGHLKDEREVVAEGGGVVDAGVLHLNNVLVLHEVKPRKVPPLMLQELRQRLGRELELGLEGRQEVADRVSLAQVVHEALVLSHLPQDVQKLMLLHLEPSLRSRLPHSNLWICKEGK